MNANERKCKSNLFFGVVQIADTTSVRMFRKHALPKKYLRSFAWGHAVASGLKMSEMMNKESVTITGDGQELTSDG